MTESKLERFLTKFFIVAIFIISIGMVALIGKGIYIKTQNIILALASILMALVIPLVFLWLLIYLRNVKLRQREKFEKIAGFICIVIIFLSMFALLFRIIQDLFFK